MFCPIKKLLCLLYLFSIPFASAQGDQDMWESKGPHVRIKRNDQNGSYIVFERSPDDRRLVKTTKDQNDQIQMVAKYTRNRKGFLAAGEIYDGMGTKIMRVTYGYHAKTGQLVAENMYDAQVKNYYPPQKRDANGNRVEMPIRRVYYFYDADGNQSKAISLVSVKGKKAEELFSRTRKPLDLFGEDPDFDEDQVTNPLKDNPFEEERKREAAKKK